MTYASLKCLCRIWPLHIHFCLASSDPQHVSCVLRFFNNVPLFRLHCLNATTLQCVSTDAPSGHALSLEVMLPMFTDSSSFEPLCCHFLKCVGRNALRTIKYRLKFNASAVYRHFQIVSSSFLCHSILVNHPNHILICYCPLVSWLDHSFPCSM